MSRLNKASEPAYPLRPNKAIDRLILQELLSVLDNYSPLNKHVYIGLGGSFLEDFRLLANKFPKMNMICVEKDEEKYKRQILHKCTKKLILNSCTLRDFLSSRFPSEKPTITWADYTAFRNDNLSEIADITRKAVPLSVIKVTVKAERDFCYRLKYCSRNNCPPSKEDEFACFVSDFKNAIEIEDTSYGNDLFTREAFSEDEFPRLLSRIIYSVVESACVRPKLFLPLHSAKYSDGTIMLSVTGVICKEEDVDKIRKHFKRRFEFFSDDLSDVSIIDVPFLSTKERLKLEHKIPMKTISGTRMVRYLGYLLDGVGSVEVSEYFMAQYEQYHRLYPYFGKLIP